MKRNLVDQIVTNAVAIVQAEGRLRDLSKAVLRVAQTTVLSPRAVWCDVHNRFASGMTTDEVLEYLRSDRPAAATRRCHLLHMRPNIWGP